MTPLEIAEKKNRGSLSLQIYFLLCFAAAILLAQSYCASFGTNRADSVCGLSTVKCVFMYIPIYSQRVPESFFYTKVCPIKEQESLNKISAAKEVSILFLIFVEHL